MPLRTARVEDEPAIATLCTAAFWEEDCFCRVILPKQEDYPDDVQIFWHEWLRADWQERSKVILVAVVGDEEQATVKTRMSGQEMKRSEDLVEDTGDKVVGVAVWQRKGDDEHAQRVKDEWVDPGPNAFPPLKSTHNRALDPAAANILQEAEPYFAHHFEGPRANSWYLHLLAVHPAFRNRGFGRELVEWGLKKAHEEGVHASVISSDSKEPFYFNCGFDSIVGSMTDGEGNPLGSRNVRGGAIMFMWYADSPEALEHSS